MIDREKAISIIRKKGPVLPIDIAKELKISTIIAGAVLSDLRSAKMVNITHAKIGGSPLYYIKGQESRIQVLYKGLHEKEKKAYDMLKSQGILRDKELEPVIRVALKNIPDFAIKINVKTEAGEEIFWKWYMLPDSIVKQKINNILEKEKPIKENELKEKKQETRKETRKEEIKEEQKKIEETKQDKEKIKEKIKIKSQFLEKIMSLFSLRNIEIIDINIIRKDSEIDFVVNIQTPIGKVKYYCKARNKKKCNDKDISDAYTKGQLKGLPTLFLTTGEITKKAIDLSKKFKNMIIKKI